MNSFAHFSQITLRFLSSPIHTFLYSSLLITLITKYVIYSRYIHHIEKEGFKLFDFLFTVEIDMLLVLIILSVASTKPRLAIFKKTRKLIDGIIALFALSYFAYSLSNLKVVLEFGSPINLEILQDAIRRSDDLVLISSEYLMTWLLLPMLFLCIAIGIAFVYKKKYSTVTTQDAEKNTPAGLYLATSILAAFILITSLTVNELSFSPELIRMKGSSIVNLMRDVVFQENTATAMGNVYADRLKRTNSSPINHISRKPNIVFILLESTGYEYSPLAGDTGTASMPFLKKMSEMGVVPVQARAIFPSTTKSVFNILSGQYPVPHRYIAETELDFPVTGIAEYLAPLGYNSAYFQSASGIFERRPSLVNNLGFDEFITAQEIKPDALIFGGLNMDEFILQPRIETWVKDQKKPFVMAILTSMSHHPYLLPTASDTTYAAFRTSTDEQKKQSYYEALRYEDTFLEKIVTTINDQNNNPEGTLFIILGDHGEGFGEHGRYTHSLNLYDESLRIPLIFYWKGVTESKRIETGFYTTNDILPTIFHLIGADTIPNDLPGANILASQPTLNDTYFVSRQQKIGVGLITQQGVKYIFDDERDTIEKFNLITDPSEQHNLVETMTSEEKSRVEETLFNWKMNHFYVGHDKNTTEAREMYKWICEPSIYGECKLKN